MSRICLVFLVVLAARSTCAQLELYVDDDAPPGGDGSSWETAYTHLHDALVFAGGASPSGFVHIRIGQGSYRPDQDEAHPSGTGDRTVSFELPDAVDLLGGYAGYGAGDPFKRDPASYLTVLTGDIGVPDEPSDNSFHVLTAFGVTDAGEVNGVIIEHGQADDQCCSGHFHSGGGMFLIDASVRVIDCTFRKNLADSGGAVAIRGLSEAAFLRCSFEANVGEDAGAVGVSSMLPTTFRECSFRNNAAIADPDDRGGYGGAISAGILTLIDCSFSDNTAAGDGGAISVSRSIMQRCTFIGNQAGDDGGALHLSASEQIIDQCLFLANATLGQRGSGSDGGAIYHVGDDGTALIVNCLFSGNSAFRAGGALATGFEDGPMRLVNCSVTSNTAKSGGGLSIATVNQFGVSQIINSIVAGNAATVFDDEVTLHDDVIVEYSCILDVARDGPGNIIAAPQFVDADGSDNVAGTIDDDLRLSSGSPCIDAGDNTALLPTRLVDFSGAARFRDDVTTDDTGNAGGDVPIVDIGALEFLGDGAAPIELLELSLRFGTLLSGDSDDTAVGDGNVLLVQSQFGFSAMQANILELTWIGLSPDLSPHTLAVTVIDSMSDSGGTVEYRLRAHADRSYDIIHTSAVPIEPGLTVIEEIDAAAYVDQLGMIDWSIRHSAVATFSVTGFESAFDLIGMYANSQ